MPEDKNVWEIINEVVEQQGWKLDIPTWEDGIDSGTTDVELALYRKLAVSREEEGIIPLLFIDYGDGQCKRY